MMDKEFKLRKIQATLKCLKVGRKRNEVREYYRILQRSWNREHPEKVKERNARYYKAYKAKHNRRNLDD